MAKWYRKKVRYNSNEDPITKRSGYHDEKMYDICSQDGIWIEVFHIFCSIKSIQIHIMCIFIKIKQIMKVLANVITHITAWDKKRLPCLD